MTLSVTLAVILIKNNAAMNAFEFTLVLGVLCAILLSMHYLFSHTKRSYENTHADANIIFDSKEKEVKSTMHEKMESPTVKICNTLSDIPYILGRHISGSIAGKNDEMRGIQLDIEHARERHSVYYKLGVFDRMDDTSQRYFDYGRFEEVTHKIRCICEALDALENHSSEIYRGLCDKFSS